MKTKQENSALRTSLADLPLQPIPQLNREPCREKVPKITCSQLISLPESVMETFKVVLTFEPVDEILLRLEV